MARRPVPASADDVVTFDRKTFIEQVFDYRTGEHVTILAPTGEGKTQLGLELLGHEAAPEQPAVILVMKPRDATVRRFATRYKFKTIQDWPPSVLRQLIGPRKPPGYVLWPRETENLDLDDLRHHEIFQRTLNALYKRGHVIIFADEVYSLEHDLKLSKPLIRIWTKGRSMDCGLWSASQRPAFISRWAYQAHHLFLAFDPDLDVQKRYGEIGSGVDPDIVRACTGRLKRYQYVYIHRDDRTICIVDAS